MSGKVLKREPAGRVRRPPAHLTRGSLAADLRRALPHDRAVEAQRIVRGELDDDSARRVEELLEHGGGVLVVWGGGGGRTRVTLSPWSPGCCARCTTPCTSPSAWAELAAGAVETSTRRACGKRRIALIRARRSAAVSHRRPSLGKGNDMMTPNGSPARLAHMNCALPDRVDELVPRARASTHTR